MVQATIGMARFIASDASIAEDLASIRDPRHHFGLCN